MNEIKKLLMQKSCRGFHLREFGTFNVSLLIDKLNDITKDQWEENSYRKEIHKVHSNVDALLLLWPLGEIVEEHVKGQKNNKIYDFFEMDNFLNNIKPIYENRFGEGEFYRAAITRLKPNSDIKPHIDGSLTLLKCARTHIPLVTNNDVKFIVSDAEYTMDVGEIYELNNALTHSVENRSNQHRVHLILDYARNNF